MPYWIDVFCPTALYTYPNRAGCAPIVSFDSEMSGEKDTKTLICNKHQVWFSCYFHHWFHIKGQKRGVA